MCVCMHAHTCVYTCMQMLCVVHYTHIHICVYTYTKYVLCTVCVMFRYTHSFMSSHIYTTHRNTASCVSCVYTHSTNMHVTMARACIDIHTLSYMRVCVCVKGVYVHVCETVLIPWRTNACLSPLQWCMEINRSILAALKVLYLSVCSFGT